MHNISINRFCFSFHEGGGGGTLIFSYIRRLRPFLGAQSFLISIFFRKMNNMKILRIFLGIIAKLDYIFFYVF